MLAYRNTDDIIERKLRYFSVIKQQIHFDTFFEHIIGFSVKSFVVIIHFFDAKIEGEHINIPKFFHCKTLGLLE